jgi:hypothetical protein
MSTDSVSKVALTKQLITTTAKSRYVSAPILCESAIGSKSNIANHPIIGFSPNVPTFAADLV